MNRPHTMTRHVLIVGICLAFGNHSVAGDVEDAHMLLENWQLEKAQAFSANLLFEQPEDPNARLLAARVLHAQGAHVAALSMLPDSNQTEVGVPELFSRLVENSAKYAHQFETIETPHFRIRYLNKDRVMAVYAQDILEAAYRSIGRELKFLPAELGEKIVVEIYPNAQGLAGATGLTLQEIQNTGTIALCKFHRLMLTSALAIANGYGWADTVAHEFIHLVVSKKSNNGIPIWLHEGIAKFYETSWRSEPGGSLSPYGEKLLAKAVKNQDFISFDQMHPSMAKLPSQEAAALAFAEVFTVIEFLRKQYGPDSIPRVLEVVGQGASLNDALKKVFKRDLKGIELAWRRYINKRPFQAQPGAKPTPIRLAENEAAASKDAPLEKMENPDIQKFSRLGELLQLQGKHHAAVVEYEKANEIAKDQYPSLSYRLARSYSETGRMSDAMKVLNNVLTAHPQAGDARILAGRLELKQKAYGNAQKHYEAARYRNPFNPEIHQALATIYKEQGNDKAAAEEKELLAITQKPRAPYKPQLPALGSGDSFVSLIPKHWGPARVDGTHLVDAPYWAMPIPAGKHLVEFVGPDGKLYTHNFVTEAGELSVVRLEADTPPKSP